MRRLFVLLYVALFASMTIPAFAGGGDGEKEQDDPETLRRSVSPSSYPGGPIAKAPLATGYYVTDNDAPASGQPWQPSYSFLDTTADPSSWRRIASGPNQGITETQFGHEYFRNPNRMTDSTNDAFAGPIAIGFPFYYYGIKYDSFYVSTNALVALSNRRYVYDLQGNRVGYDQFSEDTRARSGNPATDPVPDDYGYQYVALNNDNTSPTAGILDPKNTPFPKNSLRATLAPMWDDLELSQVNPDDGNPDDYGRVYWRRADNSNKLVIYYVRASMTGGADGEIKNVPVVNHRHRVEKRQIRTNFQVVLDRRDSSVQFNYSRFDGVFIDPEQGIFQIPATAMFRANAAVGIQSHNREFTNYMHSYTQGENGFGGAVFVNGDPNGTPHTALAIQFKQWKNVVRVLEVSFQRPKATNPSEFEPLDRRLAANNYELLLGHPVLGAIRPVGIVENVSSNVGPVNITPQPIQFNVVFRIRDLVFTTRPPVYQKSSTTRNLYPIENVAGEQNANAARPNIDTIVFDPFAPVPTVVRNVGRFRAEIIATDRNPSGLVYGDRWPFDDTTGVTIFGIRRVELPYITTFDNYSVSEDGVVPDVTNWVSIGAEVVDGDVNTYNPPPPRSRSVGARGLNSPVAKLDRRDIGGAFYNSDIPGLLGGDTLISFPINLAGGVPGTPTILISYERAGRQEYPRGWSDALRLGPEQAVYNTLKTGFFQVPDILTVEFAEPSNDEQKINNITNARRWSEADFLSTEGSIPAETFWGNVATPRWAVFGGGGGQDTAGNIIIDEFDGGKDFLFRRGVVPIPRRWTVDLDIAKYFRFRLRVISQSHKNPVGPPADDEDPFYVDNVIVSIPDKPEVEVTGIEVDWPYTEAPASQARAIPMSVKVSNNGTTAATAFGVALTVENRDTPPTPGFYNYYRYKTIISLGAGEDQIEQFPSWNAQECGADIDASVDTNGTSTNYRITAQILPQGYDSYNANDNTWTDFKLRLGATFAYDFVDDRGTISNDAAQVSGTPGKGLNLVAPFPDPNGAQPYGPLGGSISGTFAMQFRILTRDTIRGFQALYGSANSSPDAVLYSIYKQPSASSVNAPPQKVANNANLGLVNSTRRYARRGEGRPADSRTTNPGPFYFDEYVIYELDTAYIADPGIYFVTVAQLGQTGLELGGNSYRQGQVITIRDDAGQGAGDFNIAGHPEMRQNRFWYETTVESETWNPMLTSIGNPGYPHLDWRGLNPAGFFTYQRGSWVPMIRPFFDYKSSTSCEVLPVELADFRATALTSAIRLDWQTATELNNRGFTVERRVDGDQNWADMTFVEGAGTSNQARDYSYLDKDVTSNVTYQYRLRQEDLDGTQSYSSIREARINSATTGTLANVLQQNTPNPASAYTTIPFVVAESGSVKIEICDVYGNVVRTMTADARSGAGTSVDWDLTDDNGARVANGTYVYKLIGNGFTQSRKMTVIR
ncbi:MAG: T9SS type A sorting domain-containing protein [Ignavibacteriae bacterium]|nr:T9SS type A sorting domain-containing protein [Ignavibacteriota bacterium]MCB9215069.1 T9SS type A sorting domain-containing protein [Ignavibacteria bacterium]